MREHSVSVEARPDAHALLRRPVLPPCALCSTARASAGGSRGTRRDGAETGGTPHFDLHTGPPGAVRAASFVRASAVRRVRASTIIIVEA